MKTGSWISAGAIFGLLAVVAGAFGAHALRGTLEPSALDTFGTAVRFQMYHALALLAAGLIGDRRRSRLFDLAGALFTAGILLFSGSLYLLALTGITAIGVATPFGGVSLIAAWASLTIGAIRSKG